MGKLLVFGGSLLPGATSLTFAANGRTRQERPTQERAADLRDAKFDADAMYRLSYAILSISLLISSEQKYGSRLSFRSSLF